MSDKIFDISASTDDSEVLSTTQVVNLMEVELAKVEEIAKVS